MALTARSTIPQEPRSEELVHESSPRELAQEIATEKGLDVDKFLTTIECESDFNPEAIGDRGESFGIAQIHLSSNQDVSKEQALDYRFSLQWMASEWQKHHERKWTCFPG